MNENWFQDDEHNEKSLEQEHRPHVNHKRLSSWRIVFIGILLIGVGLCIFSLFHHVLGKGAPMLDIPRVVLVPDPSAAPTAKEKPVQQIAEAPQPTEDLGMWGAKYADRFAAGDVERSDNSYKSKDVCVTIEQGMSGKSVYYIADIYIRNIDNLRTAFADGKFGKGLRAGTVDMAAENKAIVSVSGDYYSNRDKGIVIRNAKLYRDKLYKDVCVIYQDGTMQTYSAEEFDIHAAIANGAYQAWSFGPMLLTDGQPMQNFNSDVTKSNPRCAIGYFEPGHYCFVVVDGRQPGYSQGITMGDFSQLFYDLGCKEAYNLDGGQTAMMVFGDELANKPYKGGRNTSDILYIGEVNDENKKRIGASEYCANKTE